MFTFLHPHFAYFKTQISGSEIVRFEQFSDGWPRIFLENTSELEDKEVTYIGDFLLVEDFFPQMAFLDGLLRAHISRLDIVIPFLAVASMERDTPSGELGIASLFCRMFGTLGDRLPGRVHIHLYDIHDEREVLYFPACVQIHHHTTTDILKVKIGALTEKPIILFPDTGAKKAFSRFFRGYEIVTCSKVRTSPTELEMHFEWGDMTGRSVMIIDDHIRSWGTLIEAARAVRARWASSVSTFAPHAVFAGGVPDAFLSTFDTFYTTDTIPKNRERFSSSQNVQVFEFWKDRVK